MASRTLPKRHVVRHRKLSKAAANAAPRITAQSPTSSSTVPVLGGTWQPIGPQPVASVGAPEGEVAGRVTAIAVDPTNSATVYVGTADGGVWKTTNGTSSSPAWTPLFDMQNTLAIGAIAIDPKNTATLYVGTGEPNDCQDCLPSQGVFKSTDGGTTWTLLANSPVHRTMAIVVDSSNSSHVLVATTKGLWMSSDAGSTWSQNTQIATVTYRYTTGGTASGGMDALVQDPVTPSVFWAAMGDWCATEGGSIVRSTDSGATWAEATHFPSITPAATRLALALGKDANNHVHAYAVLASCSWSSPAEGDGQLLGIGVNADADGSPTNWTVYQPSTTLPDLFQEPGTPASYQGWYDITAAVDPTNANEAVFGGVTLLITTDGGVTYTDIARPYSTDSSAPPLLHPDFHAAVFTGANRFYVGNDGGVWYTSNAGTTGITYTNLNHTLGITQLYAGSSPSNTYLVGGSQDNGTLGLVPGGPTQPTWKQLLDGDGGWTAIDPSAGSKVIWAEQTNLDLYKGDTSGSSWSEIGPCGTSPCKENTDFIAPFLMDPTNPSILYAGSTFVYRTTAAGPPWTASPDLTYDGNPTYSDDDLHTMAEATVNGSTTLLTGSRYGRAFLISSANSTSSWTSASAWIDITGTGATGLPAYDSTKDTGNSWITGLAVNPSNPSEAWATIGIVSGSRVFHTTNAGGSGGTVWSDITGTSAAAVPNVVIDSITVDPQHPSTVFIGTDAGAMVCGTCGGSAAVGSWAPLGTGLPNVRIDSITLTSDDGTIAAWTHGRSVWTLSNAPHAVLQPTSLSFGNQSVGTSSASQAITVTNKGTTPLVITNVATSGDYTQTNNCATVLPGTSCTINVTFSPSATGTRNGSVTVTDNAADSPQSASLTGNGTPAPNAYGSLNPTSVSFGNQEVGQTSAPMPVTLTDSGNMAMSISAITTSSSFGESDNCPRSPSTLGAGASCTINVTFTPPTTGTQSGTLTVTDNGTNSPQTASLSGTGVQAKASLTPSSLTFPNQHVGTTSAGQPLTLSNTGNEAMTITSITTTGDFKQTNNCGSSLAANGSCTIMVTFTPSAAGNRTGTLSVSDSAPGSPQTASLSGTGTQPQASLSPSSLSFGNQRVGTSSASQIVTLTNGGNEALTVNSVTTSGDFSQTNTCGTPVAPNNSCSIYVTFTPTASGSRTGVLTVTDSAPGSPQTASLSGTGTQPQASLSVASLAFAAQDVNTISTSQTVTLSNNGNQSLTINGISASGDFNETNGCGSSLAAQAQCTISVTFAPANAGSRTGTLTVSDDAPGSPHTVALSGQGLLHFYFAEGYTGPGFTESLSMLAPNHDAHVTIDFYTPTGHSSKPLSLAAGHVALEPVNADVASGPVSIRVTMDQPGVVERTIHFNFGSWYGSTDKVGATQPQQEWDFAEGSTLPAFSEYLSLENPNGSDVPISLNYETNTGATATKTVKLPANTRNTVEVFNGSLSSSCSIVSGTAVGCGVGRPFQGVSVQVLSQGLPIIAERPFYVNGYSFGSGPIRDGHDAFGANGREMQWNFAEGSTEPGLNEYLTLQNSDRTNPSVVDLNYFNQAGTEVTKTVTLPADTRTTIEVFTGSFTSGSCSVVNGIGVNCGVGPGILGVSTQVVVHVGSPPIVAERPMYVVYGIQNGGGTVAGAHDVVGANQLAQNFGFAWASTLAGDDDYLTIGNPTSTPASVTITYYGPNGQLGNAYMVSVGSHVRQTVQLWMPAAAGGVGSGQRQVGIIITSSQPIQVEKPTYSSNSLTYGATDSPAYSPSGF